MWHLGANHQNTQNNLVFFAGAKNTRLFWVFLCLKCRKSLTVLMLGFCIGICCYQFQQFRRLVRSRIYLLLNLSDPRKTNQEKPRQSQLHRSQNRMSHLILKQMRLLFPCSGILVPTGDPLVFLIIQNTQWILEILLLEISLKLLGMVFQVLLLDLFQTLL